MAVEFENRAGFTRVPVDLEQLPNHAETGDRFYQGIVSVARKLMRLQGITITVVGAENIPAFGGALIAMNHTGYYDFIFGGVPAFLRGRRLVRFMAKKEVFDVRGVGAIMRAMKHVPVDRSQGAASIDEAVHHLQCGHLVGIFPEATISRSFELKDFKSGAVRIAGKAGTPLIPMVCWGSQRIWTKGGVKHLGRSRTPIRMHVGAPIALTGDAAADTAALKAAMQQLLDAARTGYEADNGVAELGQAWMPAALGGTAPTLDDANRMDAAERDQKAAARRKAAEQKAVRAVQKADKQLARRAQKQMGKLAKWARKNNR